MGARRRFTLRAAGLVSVVTVTIAAGPLTAAVASPSGWRIDATIGSASSRVGTGDFVTTGAADAWASWTCGPCPSGTQPEQNLMQHWNGQHWGTVDLPAALHAPAVIAGMDASSAKNLWVFTDSGRAVVFDGSHWTTKVLPDWVIRPISGDEAAVASAVFSASDVWAFSIQAASQPALAGHFTGGSWHKVTLPLVPGAVMGLSPADIWVYGFAKSGGSRILGHWNGKAWQTVSLPKGPSGSTLVASDPVALGAKSIWLVGEVFPKSGPVTFDLLHWNGHWSTTHVPASAGEVNQMASDGHGGFWMIVSRTVHSTEQSDFAHFSGGHWTFDSFPKQGSLDTEPGVLSSVPGSRSMWSIGFLVDGSTPEFGAILKFSP